MARVIERINTPLARHSLDGLLEIKGAGEDDAGWLSNSADMLEQGTYEWSVIASFIRMANIYRITPPQQKRLIVSSCPAPSTNRLPLAMAAYSIIGDQLTHRGRSMALQRSDGEGNYSILGLRFHVVQLSEMCVNHMYRASYNPEDPPVRTVQSTLTFPHFSAMLVWHLINSCGKQAGEGVRETVVVSEDLNKRDERFRSLLTDRLEGYTAVDYHDSYRWGADDGLRRIIMLKGLKHGDTVNSFISVGNGHVAIYTTESTVEGATAIAARHPVAVEAARPILDQYNLTDTLMNAEYPAQQEPCFCEECLLRRIGIETVTSASGRRMFVMQMQ
ncbi:unnamed protein product [Vitrella brassicaformis CCMP3155]|uniref:Uncharacterized protein n=1 Tax=Vitrella brassicaformis (strain CCMP3155) TaxID=1169540 RepID=A0A0G4FU67_VITBC|nr:unnamed protein product [Vitrella brassicaformis CCMP3155]|eukprot:CEM18451.1 unnamed protein product [Vitrella brassicaformis CCMP3155]